MQSMETYEPRVGDYFLTQIGGFLGFCIRVGQTLTGDASRYTHAGIVIGNGRVVQAEPKGATIVSLASVKKNGKPLAFSNLDLTEDQREILEWRALGLKGVPYSFLDYLSLILLSIRVKPKWLRKRVADSGHMICSQLVDDVYQDAGVHLFQDGRAPGDVTPGDLAHIGTIEHYHTGPWV